MTLIRTATFGSVVPLFVTGIVRVHSLCHFTSFHCKPSECNASLSVPPTATDCCPYFRDWAVAVVQIPTPLLMALTALPLVPTA